jgi:hypothetical protein
MTTITILAIGVCWFVIALVLVIAFGLAAEKIREHSKTSLIMKQGDFEADRPRPCPLCGGYTAIYVGDMDKCMECGFIHR